MAATEALAAQWKRRSRRTATLEAGEGAPGEQGTVGEVEDVHEPEDEGQPDATRKISMPMARPATVSVR